MLTACCFFFSLFSSDAPLPVPDTEFDGSPQIFSPVSACGSDGSQTSSANGGGGNKYDRATFLAHGQPRQSGRFVVIDEEMVAGSPSQQPEDGNNSEQQGGSPSPARFSASGAAGELLGENDPLALLSRLHSSLSHLLQENARLAEENVRLQRENAELRRRNEGRQHEQQQQQQQHHPPAHPPAQQQHQPQHQPSRTAHITSHHPPSNAFVHAPLAAGNGAAAAVSSAAGGRPRFATMPIVGSSSSRDGPVRASHSPTGVTSPTLRAHLSPPVPSALQGHHQYPAQTQQQQQAQQSQSAGLHQKRASLPANMGAGVASSSAAAAHVSSRHSLPSHTPLNASSANKPTAGAAARR